MKWVLCLSPLLFTVAQCAFAAKTEAPLQAKSKADFDTLVAHVRDEMKPDGRFGKLSDSERASVEGDFKTMGALFEKTPDVAAMSDADKRALFNAQEAANATLLKRDGDRLICTREMRSGSHFPVTTCKTARDMEKERSNSEEFMRRNQNRQNMMQGG